MTADVKEGQQIIDKVQGTIALWKTFADEAGVSATSKKQIARAIAYPTTKTYSLS